MIALLLQKRKFFMPLQLLGYHLVCTVRSKSQRCFHKLGILEKKEVYSTNLQNIATGTQHMVAKIAYCHAADIALILPITYHSPELSPAMRTKQPYNLGVNQTRLLCAKIDVERCNKLAKANYLPICYPCWSAFWLSCQQSLPLLSSIA